MTPGDRVADVSDTPLPRATRRGALGGALIGLVATGCDLGGPGSESPGPTPGTPVGTPSDAAEDPDESLVARVRHRVGEADALVRAAATGRPGLAADLAGFRRLHRHHLDALPGDGRLPRSRRLRGSAAAARSRVRSQEHRLQGFLADSAVAAQSGALAALLASMSAALAQQLAVPGNGQPR